MTTNTKYIISIHDGDGNIESSSNPIDKETVVTVMRSRIAMIESFGSEYYIQITPVKGS